MFMYMSNTRFEFFSHFFFSFFFSPFKKLRNRTDPTNILPAHLYASLFQIHIDKTEVTIAILELFLVEIQVEETQVFL